MTPRVNSLFSGGGTFDHGARLAGWQTVSLCEYDAQATAVLNWHHPDLTVHPDIRTLNGADLPDAELLMGGSPCQSLSVAGKRAGIKIDTLSAYLAHRDDPDLRDELSASSLYWEMVRVIKEKRHATALAFPRFVLWENVPGAFSSHAGEDFRLVLQGFTGADIPLPDGGRWHPAGVVDGDGWQAAWRVLDSQHFGVPQRRRRIFLVLDLGGHSAAQVLFESEGVSGHPAPRAEAGQGPAAPAGCSPAERDGTIDAVDVRNLRLQGAAEATLQAKNTGGQSLNYVNPVLVPQLANTSTVASTLTTEESQRSPRGDGSDNQVVAPVAINQNGSDVQVSSVAGCLTTGVARQTSGPVVAQPVSTPAPLAFHCTQDPISSHDVTPCLTAGSPAGQGSLAVALPQPAWEPARALLSKSDWRGDGESDNIVVTAPAAVDLRNGTVAPVSMSLQAGGIGADRGMSINSVPHALQVTDSADPDAVAFALRGREDGAQPEVHGDGDTVGALRSASGGSSRDYVATPAYAVRRLTPVECERLQALPDGFTEVPWKGGVLPDSARYRILGNGGTASVIAWILRRVHTVLQGGTP